MPTRTDYVIWIGMFAFLAIALVVIMWLGGLSAR